jgi:hypothetical protein
MRRGASLDSLWDGQEKDLRLRSCTCSFKEMISFDKEEDSSNDTHEVVAQKVQKLACLLPLQSM